MDKLQELLDAGSYEKAYQILMRTASTVRTYNELKKLVQVRQHLNDVSLLSVDALTPIRIALAGNGAITYLTPLLPLLMESRGLSPQIYEVPYGSIEAEIMRPHSALSQFRPDLLVVIQTPLAINDWPPDAAGEDTALSFVTERVEHILSLCRYARERFGCEVVIDNWHPLPTRPHGSWGRRMPADQNTVIRRMNEFLDRHAPPWMHLHDVYGLTTLHGVKRWVDQRLWFLAKQPISFDCVGLYLSDLAATISVIYRSGAKCVVLDLDNTLWGGVVADDGLAGIRIREGDPQGEAFRAFQRYLLRLKQRGILLAVCSKNELETAREPFVKLPDMLLKLNDFVCFKASWDAKPHHLEAIAKELNIGLDALVFVDDNPVERAHVCEVVPAVRVVELPEDPAHFPAALDRSGWFEIASLTTEDLDRTSQYLANAQRTEAAASMADYETFLASLDQRARISEFEPTELDRITQLVNKTNQFSLTTRRVTRSEIESLMKRSDVLTATVRLRDRFGDNGLIAVWYASILDEQLQINQWVMSCRVFARGVEEMLMNHVVQIACRKRIRQIIGLYAPTAKNSLVRNLYERLGFFPALGVATERKMERWILDVDAYQPLKHTIALDEELYE